MRLADASTLIGSLPRICAAVEAGQLRWWQVRRTVQAASSLVPEAVPLLDARVAELAVAGRTRSGFQGTLQRLVLALDPEQGERALDVALADRTISVRPDRDVPGMAVLFATMPAEGAITVTACLDRLADSRLSVPPAGLPAAGRSADARRLDALTGLAGCVLDTFHTLDAAVVGNDAAGADAAGNLDLVAVVSKIVTSALAPAEESAQSIDPAQSAGSARPRRRVRRRSGEVLVTMSVESLLGIPETPGELARWGPITANHARRLARRPDTTWRRLLTDPMTGAVLDVGRTRYQPTAAITDHVLTRDGGRCKRPGCSHAARDLDHARAWDDGGVTAVGNLQTVCRGCHTAKHAGGWTVTVAGDGTTLADPPRA